MRDRVRRSAEKIPVRTNAAVSLVIFPLMIALLVAIEGASGWAMRGLLIALFCLGGQSLFSLIHEAEHDKLFRDQRLNYHGGVLLSALFPGSFSILKAGHLIHHGRNRTADEMIDFYSEGEGRWPKTLRYYTVMGGAIWAGVPLLTALLAFLPNRLFDAPGDRERGTQLSNYLVFLADIKPWRLRYEAFVTAGLWALLITTLGLGLPTLVTYLIFGVVWSSQQFIYHVRTPLHLIEGSWNLHMWRPFEKALLNYNYHLTHHRFPNAPWDALPALADEAPWRGYMKTWATLALPPRPHRYAWPQEVMMSGPLPEPTPAEFQKPTPAGGGE